MSFDYLNEAFKKLNLLKEETFDTSPMGLSGMKSFMDSDLENDQVRVIDPEVDRDEELQDSYIGKVITNCNVCHSNIFENKEDITIDEEGVVNTEKQCPYCGEALGFTVIGEVTKFVVPTDKDADPKVTVDGEEVPVETNEESSLNEDARRFIKSSKGTQKTVKARDLKKGDLVLWYTEDDKNKTCVLKVTDVDFEKLYGEENVRVYFGHAFGGKAYKEQTLYDPDEDVVLFDKSSPAKESIEVDEDEFIIEEDLSSASKFIKNAKGTEKTIKAQDLKKGDLVVWYVNGNKNKTSVLKVLDVKRTKEEDSDEYIEVRVGKTLGGKELLTYQPDEDVIIFDTSAPAKEELEEARQYKPHTLKILRMLDEEPLTEAVKTVSAMHFETVDGMLPDYLKDADSIKLVDCDRVKPEKLNDIKKTLTDAGIKQIECDNSLTEAVNNVNVETDDSIVNVQSDEGGKVTVSTEPKAPEFTGEEAIGPVSDETIEDIEAANTETEDEPVEEDSAEGETADDEEYEDVEFDEVDEESFDDLGESYLKRVYENVDSFRTSSVSSDDNKLIVEGVIRFKSGAEKKTGFIFEAHSACNGKVRFTGKNEHFSRGSRAFALTGKIDNKKLISESLTYNYRAKAGNGKSKRIYGTINK